MRGALGWPEANYEGMALMAGVDILTGTVVVFREFPWLTVDHWLENGVPKEREDGPGHYLGVTQFFNECRSTFGCSSYFWGGQHLDTARRHARQCYDSPMTIKSLELIEVKWAKEVGDKLVEEWLKTEKIKIDGRCKTLISHLKDAHIDPDQGGVKAMRALLAGLEQQPWVDMTGLRRVYG